MNSPVNDRTLVEIAHRAMALDRPPLFDHEPRSRHGEVDHLVLASYGPPGPSFTFAAVLDPRCRLTLDQVIERASDFFKAEPGDYGILVEGDAGATIEAELKERGWQIHEDEPALVLPGRPDPTGFRRSLITRCFRVSKPEELVGLVDVLSESFEMSREVTETFLPAARSLEDDRMGWLLLSHQGEAAAVAMAMVTGPTVTVAGVATRPKFRRQGLGTAITQAAANYGFDRGCDHAALRASPMSFSLYQRMGFQFVCRHRTYVPERPMAELS